MQLNRTVLLVAVLSPGMTLATAISGSVSLDNEGGTLLFSGNSVTSGCTIFSTGNTAPPSACPTSGNGTFTVTPGSTTPPFTIGDTGTIDNLNFNSLAGGPLVGFMTVDGVQFDLTHIFTNMTGADIGECSAMLIGGLNWDSAGAACTPDHSPFEFENGLTVNTQGQADTVTVTFTVMVEAYTGSSGTNYSAATPYIGVFTTQSSQPIAGNIQTVLQDLAAGGSVTSAWSANFSPAVATPEPETMPLCGSGLVVLALSYFSTRPFWNKR